MNIGTIAHFFIDHNGTIFGITATVVCVLSIFVVWLNVFRRNKLVTGEKPDFDFGEIEKSLKKILSQTHATIQNVENSQPAGATAAPGGAGGANPAEVAALKKELEDRVKLIEDLKVQVEKAKSDDGSAALLAKIKTLEGKLSEYEIIEDDIADLSHFKEENARLKKELDSIKRGGPELVDQFAAAVSAGQAPAGQTTVVTGAPPPTGQTIVVGGAAPAASVAAPAAQTTPAPSAADGEAAKVKDALAAKKAEASLEDVVAKAQQQVKEMPGLAKAETPGTPGDVIEFGADGSAQKSTGAAAAAKVAATPATAPAPAAAPAQDGPTPTNIFAEFTGDADEGKDPLAELGEIDTNRMLEELKDLNMDMNVGAEALEEAPDMEKMASEAQNLNKK